MIVLWLLILRGIAIEFREKVASPVWVKFWDVVFAAASLLLAVFYGAALGNVVRGVPLNDKGYFFEALWTNFRLGTTTGILDWYTILVGLAALSSLSLHGALWLALKTDGPVYDRSQRVARAAWWLVLFFTVLVTLVTFRVQPQVLNNLSEHPAGFVFPMLALAGLAGTAWFIPRKDDLRSFLSSCLYLVGMLTSVVFGLYPLVLPASTGAPYSLTVYNAKAGDYGLRVGLVWWIIGLALATAYFAYVYRHFAGKVRLEADAQG
jgi:cytochrome d ubiquinol oxidase subunit II